MTIVFDEGEGRDEDGVVEIDEGFAFEEAVGDGAGFLLVHGEEALVEEGFGWRVRRRCRGGCGGRRSGERSVR